MSFTEFEDGWFTDFGPQVVEVYKHQFKAVVHKARTYFGNYDEANEIATKTFYSMLTKVKEGELTFPSSMDMIKYWFGSAIQAAKARAGQMPVNDRLDEQLLNTLPSDDDRDLANSTEYASWDEELMEFTNILPEKFRHVVYLRILKDLPYKDIGRIVGCSAPLARKRFERGIKLLRKKLKRQPEKWEKFKSLRFAIMVFITLHGQN